MGILNWLGIGSELAAPIEAVGTLYTKEKDKIAAESQLLQSAMPAEVERLKTNEILAQSASFYRNGWIAMTGWSTGGLMMLYWLPQLLIANYIHITNCLVTHQVQPFPIASTDIMQLVFLMFGGFSFHYLGKKGS